MPLVKVVTFGVVLSLTRINIRLPALNRLRPSALSASVIKLQTRLGAALHLITRKAFHAHRKGIGGSNFSEGQDANRQLELEITFGKQ